MMTKQKDHNSLQNLKQNQNLFLSLQSQEDKKNRWKYTLLILDSMLDQVNLSRNIKCGQNNTFSMDKENNIDFVKIAENLPKLVIGPSNQK